MLEALVITAQYDGELSTTSPTRNTKREWRRFRDFLSMLKEHQIRGRAFGSMNGFKLNEHQSLYVVYQLGQNRFVKLQLQHQTHNFSTSSFYASIRYAIRYAISIVPGVGSVASPGGFVNSTGV